MWTNKSDNFLTNISRAVDTNLATLQGLALAVFFAKHNIDRSQISSKD
jgi:hypothetical protein